MAAAGAKVLLVTAEESKEQVRLRAERLGALHPGLLIVAETSLPHVLTHVAEVEPDVLAVDSIQTVADPGGARRAGLGEPGARVRAPARAVGEGPQHPDGARRPRHEGRRRSPGRGYLEHIVDTVLAFEGDRHHALRMLHAFKHRFGSTHELGLFAMEEAGLVDVSDPSSLFLADRRTGLPGSVVTAVLEGARPVLVEVQALVTPTRAPMPRRSSQGLDQNRLTLLLAVLDARARAAGRRRRRLHERRRRHPGHRSRRRPRGRDRGGRRAAAAGRSPRTWSRWARSGLGGEVRQAAQTPRRLAEAARLGFKSAIVPTSVADTPGI